MSKETGAEGPAWHTFTLRLPFGLGLDDEEGTWHTIALGGYRAGGGWRDPAAGAIFGELPEVRFKFLCRPIAGHEVIPEQSGEVLAAIYPSGTRVVEKEWPVYGASAEPYEQWVSMETPNARLKWALDDDSAYAFHRCLNALNQFITAQIIAFGDDRVQPINTHDLDAVLRESLDLEGQWSFLGPLLMHPDELPTSPPRKNMEEVGGKIQNAVMSVLYEHPFVPAKLWHWRSRAAGRRGDQVDRVISLQTSVEIMLFAVWRMSLVDQHRTSAQIKAEIERFVPFERLIKTQIPRLLGGSWDNTLGGSPFALYWKDLYKLRNRIVHAAHEPTTSEGDRAEEAYKALRKYINERLWQKRRIYPRTMLARIGNPRQLGFKDAWVDKKYQELLDVEPFTWWQPDDAVGRAAASD
ncbi:hypothetical protein BH11ACT4_BH11ACT4_23730 [soil metagenome]